MRRIALLFPGQGSQYIGMGKNLYERFPTAAQTFEEANDVLGFDIKKLCFEGSMEELTKTENAQPAILTASVAAFRVYMEEYGIEPEFAAGHSLGEYSALCCAGAIRFPDAVKIVRQRGKFMQEAVAVGIGGMAAVSGTAQSIIEEECSKISNSGSIVVVSNYNSQDQIVVSGHLDAVNKISEKLKDMGARVVPLKVSAPFHSPLMQPAADSLQQELCKYTYNELNYPVISNVTALPYPRRENINEYLAQQIVKPVKWQLSMDYISKNGVETAIELGPQTVLKNLMRKNAPSIKTYSFDNESDMQAIKRLASSNEPGAEGIKQGLTVITMCIAAAVCTKNSNWDEQEYQKGFVEPYRRIKDMKEDIQKEEREPTIGEVREALEMLKNAFDTKKTPKTEQMERLSRIFEETGTGKMFEDFQIS